MRSIELRRHALRGAEISRWIERQRGNGSSAIGIVAIGTDTTDGKECPAGGIPSTWDVADIGCFEEIELVFRSRVDTTGENGEEL